MREIAMWGQDFRAAIQRLDLTQIEAAALLGTKPNTISRWTCGHQPIPHWVEREIWLWEHVPGVLEALRGRVGLP